MTYPKEVLDALAEKGITFKGRHGTQIDARLAFGATCTWFGSIHETKQTRDGLPRCPICGGVLFEMPDEGQWWKRIDEYEIGISPSAPGVPHPGYRAMWEWQRGQKKCFSIREGIGLLYAAYSAAQKESK